MTIVCNKYKFIHIHNQKTGGSSLEVVLSKFCDENDILSSEFDQLRKQMNYQTEVNNLAGYKVKIRPGTLRKVAINSREFIRRISQSTLFDKVSPLDFYYPILIHPINKLGRHASIDKIKSVVSEDTWNKYYKFTVIREPVSQLLSLYYYRKGKPLTFELSDLSYRNKFVDFQKFIDLCAENFFTYQENQIFSRGIANEGNIHYLKFENLDEELSNLSETLSLPENLAPLFKNTRLRKSEKIHCTVTGKDIEKIYNLCGKLNQFYPESSAEKVICEKVTFSPQVFQVQQG